MSKKLFVGGLSWGTNDEALRAAFEPFGRLLDVRVILDRDTGRSRGFGFVTFAEEAEADKALEKMNGADLDGRSLRVNEAEERRGGPRDARGPRHAPRGGGQPEVVRSRGGGSHAPGGGDSRGRSPRGSGYDRSPRGGDRGGYGQRGRDDRRGGGYGRGDFRPSTPSPLPSQADLEGMEIDDRPKRNINKKKKKKRGNEDSAWSDGGGRSSRKRRDRFDWRDAATGGGGGGDDWED